jgi:hypothetical protein
VRALLASAKSRLRAAVGAPIDVTVNVHAIFKTSPQPDIIIETLSENEGEFVIERIVQAVIDVCVQPGGRRALESRLTEVAIINIDEPAWNEKVPNLRPVMNGSVLEIRGIFERGEEGCPTRAKIKSELLLLLDLYDAPGAPRDLGKQVLSDVVPLWEGQLASLIGAPVPIEIAWDTFRGETYAPALRTLLRDDGELVFRPIVAAFRQLIDSGLATPAVVADHIGKVRIKNLPESEEGDMLVAVRPFKELAQGKDVLTAPEVMLREPGARVLRKEVLQDADKLGAFVFFFFFFDFFFFDFF